MTSSPLRHATTDAEGPGAHAPAGAPAGQVDKPHATGSLSEPAWQDRAACKSTPTRWFTDPDGASDIARALATCATCTVRAACLATALRHPAEADIGIWGGTTEDTRHRMRNERVTPEDVLDAADRPRQQPVRATPVASPSNRPAPKHDHATNSRLTSDGSAGAPQLTVARDANGDYTDATGRVIIFRLHGQPPWMVMVDGRPVARIRTLTEGRELAWSTLHDPPRQRPALQQPTSARFLPAARR